MGMESSQRGWVIRRSPGRGDQARTTGVLLKPGHETQRLLQGEKVWRGPGRARAYSQERGQEQVLPPPQREPARQLLALGLPTQNCEETRFYCFSRPSSPGRLGQPVSKIGVSPARSPCLSLLPRPRAALGHGPGSPAPGSRPRCTVAAASTWPPPLWPGPPAPGREAAPFRG